MLLPKEAPRPELLHVLYRSTLRLTKKRGMRTLSRVNHWLFPDGQISRLATGCDFFIPPDPHFFGCVAEHDKHVSDIIKETVEDGDVCVDVGANIGFFSMMMAARSGPTGRVYAYEPEAANFKMLEENVSLAIAEHLTVLATRAAVSDRAGALELVRGNQSTLHQVRAIEMAEAQKAVEIVPCVALGEDLRERGVNGLIKLVKIDVEGHEAAVLRGAIELLQSGRVKCVVLEVAPGATAEEVEEIVGRLDASVECWIEGAWRASAIREIPYRTDIWIRF